MGKKRDIEDIKKEIISRKKRLTDLKEKGDDACSKYDLKMGYNADFYLNKCPIIQNQINYLEKELTELTKNGIQTTLF